MIRFLGWEFKRTEPVEQFTSFAPKEDEDGAVVIAASGFTGAYIDLEGTVRSEAELISRYRTMSLHPEIISACDEITNEAVNKDDNNDVVKLNLDKIDSKAITDKLKDIMETEFSNVLDLLKFNLRFNAIFKRWYIDGRLYYHCIIDPDHPEEGIQELRYIDPRKIRKIREVLRRREPGTMDTVLQIKNEYYVYNDRGFAMGIRSVVPSATGIKIAKDAIAHVSSGLIDVNGTMVLSYLHMAIKALNELRTVEDATVIYRVSRAPERRVWYIDVGQLPKMKAEQYIRDIMVKHKNRLIYDSNTGEIKDDRKFMTMLEDYWLPRREGGRGTQVETLKGGEHLGVMEDVIYFQKRLFSSLMVPISRLNPESTFNLGRPMEITREELKFGMFVDRLRTRFQGILTDILGKQLVLKKVFSIEEWDVLKDSIEYTFVRNSYFTEMREQEVLLSRANVLMAVQPFVGMYFSNQQVRREILKQSAEDIKKIDQEIAEEQQNYQYLPQDQKAMLQQQEMQQEQMEQQGAQQQQLADQQAQSPEGQAQAQIAGAKQNPNQSLQDMAKTKSAQNFMDKKGKPQQQGFKK